MRLTAMVAVLAAGVAGCSGVSPLVRRVSNEFQCEPARVNVLERHDIADTLYDVEACGRRGRYSCVGGGRYGVYGCIHEPDPAAWDPDPALVGSLPAPSPSDFTASPPDGHRRVICGPHDGQCVFKQNGAWRWRRAYAPDNECGSMCQ